MAVVEKLKSEILYLCNIALNLWYSGAMFNLVDVNMRRKIKTLSFPDLSVCPLAILHTFMKQRRCISLIHARVNENKE